MFSEILSLGPISLRSYGLMLALSFFAGLFYVRWRARRESVPDNIIMNLAFLLILSGIIGARLFFVIFHWSDFSGNLFNAFNPFGSGEQIGIAGLNLYGGILLAIVTAMIYLRIKKQSLWQVLDIVAPAVGIGLFLTRIGCFLNGCCFGTPTDLPWCVHFPEGSIPFYQFGHQCLHPAQLYSSAYGLILFFLLHNTDKRKKFYGFTVSLLLMVEAVFRYLIEYVRYYEPEMETQLFGVTYTYNHLIAIGLFLFGLILMLVLRRRNLVERH
jgi:phosphatidylglycerol:prolipoprotein diacylglycerol transferase